MPTACRLITISVTLIVLLLQHLLLDGEHGIRRWLSVSSAWDFFYVKKKPTFWKVDSTDLYGIFNCVYACDLSF